MLGEQEWDEIVIEMAKLWDNDCHTLNRDNCYLNQDLRYEVMNKLFKLQNAHLFKDAVPCAEDVFGRTIPTKFQVVDKNKAKPHDKFFYLE
jgi:hypothetical protein